MKLKVLVILFNTILLTLCATLFFLPALLFTKDAFYLFLRTNWFFLPIFAVLFASVNYLFFSNRRLLSHIEKEQWQEVADILHVQVVEKKHFKKTRIQLLLESLFLLHQFDKIDAIAHLLYHNKPSLWRYFAGTFAASLLLQKKYVKVWALCETLNEPHPTPQQRKCLLCSYARGLSQKCCSLIGKKADYISPWIEVYAALSLFLQKKEEASYERFFALAQSSKNDAIIAIALVLMHNSPYHTEASNKNTEQDLLQKIRDRYSLSQWEAFVAQQTASSETLVFAGILKDAQKLIFTHSAHHD